MNIGKSIVPADFENLVDFVGGVLKSIRAETSAELSLKLREEYHLDQATEQWVVAVESGKCLLSLAEFLIVCQALGFSPEAVLSLAIEMKKRKKQPNWI